MRRIHTATASAGSAACHVRHLFYLLRVQHDGPAEQDTKPGTKSVAQGDREEIPATGCPIPNNPQWRPLPGDVRTGKGAVRIAQKENRKMGLGATETQLHRAEVHLGVLHGNGGGSGLRPGQERSRVLRERLDRLALRVNSTNLSCPFLLE